jgi:hypothetical protein
MFLHLPMSPHLKHFDNLLRHIKKSKSVSCGKPFPWTFLGTDLFCTNLCWFYILKISERLQKFSKELLLYTCTDDSGSSTGFVCWRITWLQIAILTNLQFITEKNTVQNFTVKGCLISRGLEKSGMGSFVFPLWSLQPTILSNQEPPKCTKKPK